MARACASIDRLEPRRLLAAGDLDTTFGGGDGKITYPFTPFTGPSTGYDVAVQSDGKFVAVGSTDPGSAGKPDFLVARFNADGTPDQSFGYFGLVKVDFGGGADAARGVFIDGTGRIVVAGTTRLGRYDQVALARLNTNGALDNTFDGDGKATFGVTGLHASANDVALAAGGKIITAGGVGSDFLVARFNANGTPDTTFGGGDAFAQIGFDGAERANGVVVQGDGKIVAAGSTTAGPGDSDVALIRLTTAGILDTTFSGDGKFNGNFTTTGADFGNGVTLDAANRIVVAGSTRAATDADSSVLLLRLTSGGQLDNTFGGGDGFTIDDTNRVANAVAVLGDGRIITAGHSDFPTIGTTHGYLSFFDANGTHLHYHDTSNTRLNAILSHGADGYAYVGTLDRFPGAALVATKVIGDHTTVNGSVPIADPIRQFAMQPDGKVILVGEDRGAFYLARVNPDGALDPTFGRQGQISAFLPAVPRDDGDGRFPRVYSVGDVLVLPDGKILALGSLSSQAVELADGLVLARFNANGTLDTTFGDGGFRLHDLNNDDSFAYVLRILSDGKILAAGTYDESTGFLTRFTADGDIDLSFGGGDGLATGGPGWLDFLDIAPDGKIVYGGETYADDGTYLRRFNADGTPDATFGGGDGQVVQDSFLGRDLHPEFNIFQATDVAVAPDGKVVLLAHYNDSSEVAVIRLTTAGVLDTTFSGDGFATADFAAGDLAQQRVDVQADGKIVVAGTITPGTGGHDLFLARFTSGGAVDNTFGGGDGIAVADLKGKDEAVIDLRIVDDKAVLFVNGDLPATFASPALFGVLRYHLGVTTTPPPNPNIFISNGVLTVNGTSAADTITLDPAAGGKVIVKLNASSATFDLAAFTRFRLNGNAGSDKVTVNAAITKPGELHGGSGYDSLVGGSGAELLDGGIGDDTLQGGGGNDTLRGNAGNDRLAGGPGTDRLDGGDGADTGVDTAGDTVINVETTQNTPAQGTAVITPGRTLLITGTGGADDIQVYFDSAPSEASNAVVLNGQRFSFPQADFDLIEVNALGGDDRVHFGAPQTREDVDATINLGDGNDRAELIEAGALVNGGNGNDTLFGEDGGGPFEGGPGVDLYDRFSHIPGFGDLTLSSTTENGRINFGTLTGNALDNVLEAGAGATILGMGGNDTLISDADWGDSITLDGGAGNDTLRPQSSNMSGNLTFISGPGNDSMVGGDGNDMFHAGANADGADTITGNGGFDTVDFSARTADLLLDLDGVSDDGQAAEGDNLAADIETVIGGSGNDRITGSAVANLLVGNGGNDTVIGGDGHDSLDGGAGVDHLEGHAGNDTLRGGDANDRLFGGSGNDNLLGEAGDDLLYGQGGADFLDGGIGAADRGFDDGQDTLTNVEVVLT